MCACVAHQVRQEFVAFYLAIWHVGIARDVTELLIAKFANATLQLEACEGASHAPEPDVPSSYIGQTQNVLTLDSDMPHIFLASAL